MPEIEKLRKRKEDLLKAIETTRQRKNQIIKTTQELLSLYNSGRISKKEYNENLKKKLENRTPEQWIKYYDDYINYYNKHINFCNKLIKKQKFRALRKKVVPILIISLMIIAISIFILSIFIFPEITEFFKQTIEKISVLKPALEEAEEISGPFLGKTDLSNSTIQFPAVINKPVKWKTNFKTDGLEDTITLPKDSKNITIKKGKEKQDITSEVDITEKGILSKRIEIKLKKEPAEYELEYETPAPKISEEKISDKKKKITITGPDDVHYTNILSFAKLPKELKKNEEAKIKLYEIKNINGKETRKEIKFTAYDTNENGLLDFIEWIADSNTVYEAVIEITKAEHLNENREFISDIYNETYKLDNIWSEEISDGHYVRVTFERRLDSSKDITIYPRVVSGTPRIEVYEVDRNEIIAEFTSINSNKYNKIFLTNLISKSQDVFDLKILNGNIEIDHIIDPIEGLIPIVHENTELNSINLIQSQVEDITDDGLGYIKLDKRDTLNIELSDILEIDILNNAKCSLTYYTDANFPVGEGAFNVYDSFGGTLLDNINIIPSAEYNTVELIDLQLKGLTPSEVNTIFISIENLVARKPYSLYVDKVVCTIDYTLPAIPEIVYISDILEEISPGETDRDLTPAQSTPKTFEFYVYHPNINNLPTGVAVDDTNALLTLTNIATPLIERKSSDWVTDPNAVTCVHDRDVLVAQGGCPIGSVAYDGEDCRVYSCTVAMQYWDDSSFDTNWQVKAMIKDNSGNEDGETFPNNEIQPYRETYFNRLEASAVTGSETGLDFGIIDYSILNIEPVNVDYPLIIKNRGNTNLNPIEITAHNLLGIQDPLKSVPASRFTSDIDPIDTLTLCTTGKSLSDNTPVDLLTPIIHEQDASGELRICLTGITPTETSPQDYATTPGIDSWVIDITYALVAFAIRNKKKKKRKRKTKEKSEKTKKKQINTNIKEDSLIQALNLTTKELKQEYSEEKQKIIKLLTTEIKKKYKLNNKEITSFIEIRKQIQIPTNIFSKKLGALEAITKYLRENLNLNYKEIAVLLNRNERTIWTAYNKSKQKQSKPLEIKEIKISMPVSIFKNKKPTILESTIIYLKQKKLKYVEIADLLNRNQRNIWTIYSRAIRK